MPFTAALADSIRIKGPNICGRRLIKPVVGKIVKLHEEHSITNEDFQQVYCVEIRTLLRIRVSVLLTPGFYGFSRSTKHFIYLGL